MDRAEAVREMTFEEEAALYQREAKAIFAKEDVGCEAPPINHTVRRGMRIIRKAREEIADLREQDATDINVGNKWISVDERLPDKDALVLCIGAKGGMFLGFIRSYYECQNSAYTYVPNSRGCRYTTHWMPLPSAPKEVFDG